MASRQRWHALQVLLSDAGLYETGSIDQALILSEDGSFIAEHRLQAFKFVFMLLLRELDELETAAALAISRMLDRSDID